MSSDQLTLLKNYVNDLRQIYISNNVPNTLISQIISCEEIMFKNSKIFKEILKWIRFSKKEITTTQDGMYFKNLAINSFEAVALMISLKSSYLQKLIWHSGGKFLFRKKGRAQLAQASEYVLVTISDASNKTILNSARKIFKLWLGLNQIGFGFHPYSFASLLGFDLLQLPDQTLISQEDLKLIQSCRDQLASHFKINPSEKPFWFFRTGLLLQPSSKAVRKDLDLVFKETIN